MEPLVIPSHLDSLDQIKDYVLAAAADANLEKKATYNLRLAIDEIATNIIKHGYPKANQEGEIQITAKIDEKTLTIYLEDTAIPFDPISRPSPCNLNDDLNDRPIGGLGIYLAKESVDQFLYERVDHGNRNIFIVNRP
ncbi:MAG: ATP-binding protein [Cyanobacteria bacterium J06592_8]